MTSKTLICHSFRMLAIAMAVFLLLGTGSLNAGDSDASFPNLIPGYEKVYSGLELLEDIPLTSNATKVVIADTLVDLDGNSIRSFVAEYPVSSQSDQVQHNLKYFGIHLLNIAYYAGDELAGTAERKVVRVTDEYNVAPITATVPVMYFTLMSMDQDGETAYFDPQTPSIVALERREAYDWNNLPGNMTTSPFMADADFESSGYISQDDLFASDGPYWKYIEYLYQLNPQSEFVVIGNDYLPVSVFTIMELGIPLGQIRAVLFSDGTATYDEFRSIFGDGAQDDSSLEIYRTYAARWEAIKEKHLAADPSFVDDIAIDDGPYQVFEYVPVWVNDPDLDVYWIVNRKNPDTWGTSSVYTDYISSNERVLAIGMSNLFSALNEDEKEAFKALYSIDEEMIDTSNGKPLLVFLGTSTQAEADLEKYLGLLQVLAGDEYNSYYKGHPGYIYNGAEERDEILEKLGVVALDPSVPAELFGYYYDNAVYAGYPSSTYSNVENSCFLLTFVDTMEALGTDISNYIGRVQNYVEKTGENSYVIVRNFNTENAERSHWDGNSASLKNLEWSAYTESQ